MGGLKCTGEELRAEEGKVVMDGKDLGFCVKMVNGNHLQTAGGYADGGVLDVLEVLDGGGGGSVGDSDRGGVREVGGDEGLVGEDRVSMFCSQEVLANVLRMLTQGEARSVLH